MKTSHPQDKAREFQKVTIKATLVTLLKLYQIEGACFNLIFTIYR